MYGYLGRLLVAADERCEAPVGIRSCTSKAGGRTRPSERETAIRADLPSGGLGDPTTVEYAPGRRRQSGLPFLRCLVDDRTVLL